MTFFRLALGAAKRRKTPREKKKYITPREKTKNKSFKWRYFAWRFSSFKLFFRLFAWQISLFRLLARRYFVFSLFRVALFRLFAWRFSSFSSVISSFRRAITPAEKTKWHKSATIETTSLFNSEDHEIPEVVRSNPVRTIPKV